ncbi:MAG: type II toxin-antitoxin system HigB family toxin [Cryomorphaceae bacterium]|nr:type II toxin-antitoxin system HigB family toxin [Flavobacteriales bacterium]
MAITGRSKLEKLKRKNRGNKLLGKAIDKLIVDLKQNAITDNEMLKKIRPDADLVHSDGFYIFNIHIHRTMILLEFEDNGEVTVAWCGSHDEYEQTFRNNKNTIKKWLRNQGFIN